MSSLVRTQALNYSLVMNGVILGDNDDGDHVPELGVEGVDPDFRDEHEHEE